MKNAISYYTQCEIDQEEELRNLYGVYEDFLQQNDSQ